MTTFTTKRDLAAHIEPMLGPGGSAAIANGLADHLWSADVTDSEHLDAYDLAELAVALRLV